ncbi:hypothetical protein EDC04DRAFT_2731274 [Pisolithus marmoratus]|nr:hypothetical protein EDC04DRAFT_2731274 [Pisolithus marmoratus]
MVLSEAHVVLLIPLPVYHVSQCDHSSHGYSDSTLHSSMVVVHIRTYPCLDMFTHGCDEHYFVFSISCFLQVKVVGGHWQLAS